MLRAVLGGMVRVVDGVGKWEGDVTVEVTFLVIVVFLVLIVAFADVDLRDA